MVPHVTSGFSATVDVDGAGGIGILAVNAATDAGIDAARKHGVAALAVRINSAVAGACCAGRP